MSILTKQEKTQPSQSQMSADFIRNGSYSTYRTIIKFYCDCIREVWVNNNATPQEVCDQLGPDAKEAFELHSALGQFLSSLPGSDLTEIQSNIGTFVLNEDGTVVATPNPEPEPEPEPDPENT